MPNEYPLFRTQLLLPNCSADGGGGWTPPHTCLSRTASHPAHPQPDPPPEIFACHGHGVRHPFPPNGAPPPPEGYGRINAVFGTAYRWPGTAAANLFPLGAAAGDGASSEEEEDADYAPKASRCAGPSQSDGCPIPHPPFGCPWRGESIFGGFLKKELKHCFVVLGEEGKFAAVWSGLPCSQWHTWRAERWWKF